MSFLLHQLLSDSADRDPGAVAVRHDDRELSYGELERRSNQLAHGLLSGGVRPGDRIGLHLAKSLDAIVSLFGVLKAGACYVPIDASNPPSRLADIARQCEMRCIVASPATAPKLSHEAFEATTLEWLVLAGDRPDDWDAPLRCTTLEDELQDRPHDAPALRGTDQDLAYVLFTSGSTGRPKGVMLSHRNALTFVDWSCERFDVQPSDRLSNHAPLNFDLSIFDVFAAIKAGARVVLVPEGLSMFPIRLADFIERERITIWYSVPSILRNLLARGQLADHDLAALRLVLFAGEVFPVRHLRDLMRVLPKPAYFNLYGPTETNVCTYYEVQPIPDDRVDPVPIGRPCENTAAYVIDDRGGLVTEPGHEGLLYIGGSTVMRGYYGRPKDTAATFIRNPFCAGREEQLYCTQDWVAFDARGDLLFLGRRDHMVKIGGYRVELGEIEAVLSDHPGVREAVAVPLPDELLGSRIRAVVVGEAEAVLSAQDVRRYCGSRLPKYMIPQDVEFRPVLPRTQTDKVDRTRLRDEMMAAERR